MVWLIVILGSLALIVALLVSNKREREAKVTEKIRSTWGHPKKDPIPFDRVEQYADVMMARQGFHQLSRQTLEDIDFYQMFAFLDRTSSSVGQQFLFHKLIRPVGDRSALNELNAAAEYFAENTASREKIQKELGRLNTRGAYYITSLLEDKLLEKPPWLKFLFLSNLVLIGLLLLGIKFPVLIVCAVVPLTINMGFHYWNKGNTFRFIRSLPQLNLLIDVCENISRHDKRFESEHMAACVSELKPFQWKFSVLGTQNDGRALDEMSQAFGYILELIKGFFLIEVYVFFHIISEIESRKNSITTLFNYVGGIDTAISVASVRAGTQVTCIPEFLENGSKRFEVKGVCHPLVNNCVKNDLYIHSKGVLITGSNMSGKTTFLRTLLINSLLAQTINTCFAEEFKTPILKQFSSIRIDDSVIKGTSYFFEEVNLMGTLVREAGSSAQNIFILDEVFKGTNTIERVAAAKAILSYLNRDNNIVVVSTHDIELSLMLEGEYDLYHFDETFNDDQLHFDHKLKPGRLKSGNAIRILALANYPEEVIQEATSLAKANVLHP